MKAGIYGAVVLMAALVIPGTQGAVIRVPQDQPTVQAGIEAAVAGDTVLVGDGTYAGVGNRGLDLAGKAVAVMSEHGAAATVLDCGFADRGFFVHSGETEAALICGFTVTRGAGAVGSDAGGAVYCTGASPTFCDCLFVGCQAAQGGAVELASFARPVFRECRFENNSAAEGGGMRSGFACVPTLEHCTFSGNSATASGGGLSARNSSPMLIACAFANNTADLGGGMALQEASPQASSCRFTGNLSHEFGGGIYGDRTALSMVNGVVSANTASSGGGLFLTASADPRLVSCEFTGNLANLGGGLYLKLGSSAQFSNCLLADNRVVKFGAGAICQDSSPAFTACTFAGNQSVYGGGVHCSSNSNPILYLSVLWDNVPDGIFTMPGAAPVLSYTDTQDGQVGPGNFQLDPLFTAGPRGGRYLSQESAGQPATSPCVDAGDAAAPAVCFETHLGPVCLGALTTRSDETVDADLCDLGYHYRTGGAPTPQPTPPDTPSVTPLPSLTPTPTPTSSVTSTAAAPSPTCVATSSPAPSAVPSATPLPTGLRVVLEMPRYVRPRETFGIDARLINDGASMTDVPLVCAISYAETFWFWPSWCCYSAAGGGDLDYRRVEAPHGEQRTVVLEAFSWPETGEETLFPIYAYGLLLTSDLSAVQGLADCVEWGYGP